MYMFQNAKKMQRNDCHQIEKENRSVNESSQIFVIQSQQYAMGGMLCYATPYSVQGVTRN